MNSRDERSVADLGLYINKYPDITYYNIHLSFDERWYIRLVWKEGELYNDLTSGIIGVEWNF